MAITVKKPNKSGLAAKEKKSGLSIGFDITNVFHGYRSKEDLTNLPPGYLVSGSQNVFVNTSGQIQSRYGVVLDGQAGTALTGILGSYDWYRGSYGDQHLRSGNSKLQYRYVASAGDVWKTNTFTANQVFWIDLKTSLNSNYVSFTQFFDTTELINVMLFVDRESFIYEWSGAVGTVKLTSKNNISITGNSASLTSESLTSGSSVATVYGNGLAGTSFQGLLQLTGNPSAGDTLTLTINGTAVGIQFVSVIGAVAGNVLIGATAADTITNLLGLLQNPGTTNATQVAFSGGNQTLVGYSTYASTNSITITGTNTWAQNGFYTAKASRAVVINGNSYTYTSDGKTTAIWGMADPTGEANQSVVHQAVISTANSAMTTLPATFRNDIIGNLKQQVYVGSLISNNVYISKISNYKDYSQSSPRIPGDGYTATVDGLVRAIRPQENTMYVSWGDSGWTTFEFNLSADLTKETVVVTPLKVANLQAALSQGLTTNIGNDLAFVTFEPTFSTMGRVANNLSQPSISNISDPIKNDFDSYGTAGFLDGHVVYTKYFIWVSLPTLGIVRRYNIQSGWWEPPFIMSIGRFSVINGAIYGHDYNTDQSYQMETGNNDNGNPIHCIAAMSYDNFGDRVAKKRFEEWYVEGYIQANTTLNAVSKFDFGGYSGISTFTINGLPSNNIFQTVADGSLGKNPLGEEPIGSITDSFLQMPKFRVIFTTSPIAFYEYQAWFETNDVDYSWSILAFGPRLQSGPNPGEIRI